MKLKRYLSKVTVQPGRITRRVVLIAFSVSLYNLDLLFLRACELLAAVIVWAKIADCGNRVRGTKMSTGLDNFYVQVSIK